MRSLCHFACALLLAAAAPAATAAHDISTSEKIEADGTTTLTHEALVDAKPAELWQAISTAEGWMKWAVPVAWHSPSDPDVLETSYDANDKPGSPNTIQQRFLVRLPERLLAFRTIKAPEGFPNWDAYSRVTSIFELEPAGQQTRLRLTSTGYPDSEAGRQLVRFFEQGNAQTLAQLQTLFRPSPTPAEE